MKRRRAIKLTTMISMSVPLKLVAEAHIKGARYEKQNNHSAEDEIIHTAKNLAY
jgi:hypothetical protein